MEGYTPVSDRLPEPDENKALLLKVRYDAGYFGIHPARFFAPPGQEAQWMAIYSGSFGPLAEGEPVAWKEASDLVLDA